MTEPTQETENLKRAMILEAVESEPVKQGRSLVVTIGINEYVHWQKLKNAVQDAIGLQQTLIDKLGFSAPIPPLLNETATKAAIESLIEDQLREELQEDDNLVLFFAGHGHTRVDKLGGKVIGETGFIVPVEARGPKEYWSDYYQINRLLESISRLPARHILVILDSCHSGFALGEAMKIYKSANRYERDLSNRISRKVITSARREQLALDGGPIPGHSLFTGTLVDGFNWGKADLDGNGLITSSELGLFIQQQVAQASQSNQTPDFGSFYFDDRGEMVISLREQSFDALKARAFSALQNGKFTTFKKLVEQVISLRPESPEALYLEYRLMLSESMLTRAAQIVDKLYALHLPDGIIPLSQYDLWTLKNILNIRKFIYIPSSWNNKADIILSEIDFPLDVKFLAGWSEDTLKVAQEQDIGEQKTYIIPDGSIIRFSLSNFTNYPIYVYFMEIDARGRIISAPLWENELVAWNGLQPGETELSYPFYITASKDSGEICEIRLFSSKIRNYKLLVPPHPSSYITKGFSNLESDWKNTRMKVIRYIVNRFL